MVGLNPQAVTVRQGIVTLAGQLQDA